jgi:hypothetical protein
VLLAKKLETPLLPLLVPSRVFDAFAWCASDTLEWRSVEGSFETGTPLDGADPARMVFVFHAECTFLPQELARLHAFGLGLTGEHALAPYAIDDATDELYAHRVRPRDLLWLAADNLNALFWGLHDWAHFHNHGPFEERAFTELQCDASALAWLWRNRDVIGLAESTWERARREAVVVCARRFEAERIVLGASDLDMLTSDSLQNLAGATPVS